MVPAAVALSLDIAVAFTMAFTMARHVVPFGGDGIGLALALVRGVLGRGVLGRSRIGVMLLGQRETAREQDRHDDQPGDVNGFQPASGKRVNGSDHLDASMPAILGTGMPFPIVMNPASVQGAGVRDIESSLIRQQTVEEAAPAVNEASRYLDPLGSAMRIAHLSTMRDFYGGEVCLLSLAEGMLRRGHFVDCAVRPDSVLARELVAAGLRVSPMPMVDWFDPGTVWRLWHWLREGRFDILHTHLPRDYYIAATVCAGLPVRLVGTRHHLAPIRAVPLKRPFLARFRRLVAVSEAVRRTLVAADVVPADRIVTIHNGVEVRPDGPAPEAEALRRELGLIAGQVLVGYVGRISAEKGLETLLAAFRGVASRRPEVHLALVGGDGAGGAYSNRLRSRALRAGLGDRVHFCGYRCRAERLVAGFDVQVVPSHAEPFGLVTLEALARGRAVIATRSGGSPEIVRDGQDGLLFSPHDVDELANLLGRLLDDGELRRRLGRQGRERVRNVFDRERMLERTEQLYRTVLRESESAAAISPAYSARPGATRRSSAARRSP